VFRNKAPPNAPKASTAIALAELKGTDRKNRRSISGSLLRLSDRTRPASETAAVAKHWA
jgi:hypothetical protein